MPIAKKQKTFNPLDMKDLKVQYTDIRTIHRWKENPKTPQQMKANALELIPLLKSHGFKTPLVCWSRNRVIYKGNTTHLASEMLKLKEVPVVFANFPDEQAAITYALSDNNAGVRSEWDLPLLKTLMAEKLQHIDHGDLKILTGFKEKEFNAMLLVDEPGDDAEKKLSKKGEKFDSANFTVPLSIAQSNFILDVVRDTKQKLGVKLTSDVLMHIFEFYTNNAE